MLLRILTRVFGRKRGANLHFAFVEFGFAIVFGLLFLVLAITFFLRFQLPHHNRIGYVTADVVGVIPRASVHASGIIVDIQLPDGTFARVSPRSGAIMGSIVDTACVEKRQYSESKEFRYHLVPPHKCDSP